MSDTSLGLQRYEGRYLTHWGWHDGKDISRYLNVVVTGDQLTAQTESVTYPVEAGFLTIDDPVVERERGEPHPLCAAAEHTFDAVGYPRSYRFVLQDADTARSLVVIRDGEPSEPCPRFVPLPDEVPGRRERGEWFDLGQPALCMMARDVPALKDFYERLGFATRSAAPNLLQISQGWTNFGFLGFQKRACINYRGPSILATGSELAKRGYVLAAGRLQTTEIQADEAGGFSIYDPDGHVHFFNTHAPERAAYDAWVKGTLAPGTGNHHTRNTMVDPVNLPLGNLVACLGVTDLDESVSFYRGMGFAIIDQDPDSATLFSRPAREDRYAFPLRLRRAAGPAFSFGFLCEDVDGVCASIKERGIDMIATPDGPAFVDPDGNCVTLFTAPQG